MSIYGSGFINILIYGIYAGGSTVDENVILTEAGDDLLTESSLPILTET